MIDGVKGYPLPRLTRRRFLGWTISLGALASAACRSAPPSGPPPTVVVLALAHPVAAVQQLLGEHAAAAAREAGVQVSLQSESTPASLRTRLRGALAAKNPPDVGLFASTDSAPLAAQGLLRELRDSLDRIIGLNGDLFPPLNDLATAGPFADRAPHQKLSVWAIPYLSLGGAWLARRDLLLRKGLAPPTTFDEAAALVQKLVDPASETFGWGASLPLDEGTDNLVQATLLAHGVSIFDPAGSRVVLNADDATAPLQTLRTLYRSDAGGATAPPGVRDWSTVDTRAAFAAGRVALTIDYGGMYSALIQETPTVRDAIVALSPPAGPKGWFTAAQTTAFVVYDRLPATDRAITFVERVFRPTRYEQLARAGFGSAIPPYSYQTKGPFWDDDPNYAVFFANARGDPARGFQFATPGQPAPLTLPVAAVRTARVLAAALRDVVAGDLSPAVAATSLRESCLALARESYALQRSPTPTPVPTWLRLLRSAGFDR